MRYKRMWGQEAQKDTFTFEEFLAARVSHGPQEIHMDHHRDSLLTSSGWEFGPYQTF